MTRLSPNGDEETQYEKNREAYHEVDEYGLIRPREMRYRVGERRFHDSDQQCYYRKGVLS